MPVFVDPLYDCIPNRYWAEGQACHMFSDSLNQLHSMAMMIGVSLGLFQPESLPGTEGYPHYDLTEEKRAQAVAAGAVELTHEEALAFVQAQKEETRATAGQQAQP